MKSLSMFNKPVSQADNKQGGVVALEYIIIAFIATFVIICGIWFIYDRLQAMMASMITKLTTLSNQVSTLCHPGNMPIPSP